MIAQQSRKELKKGKEEGSKESLIQTALDAIVEGLFNASIQKRIGLPVEAIQQLIEKKT